MHLAVDARERAVGVDDGRGVVVQAGGAPLEERRDDHDVRPRAPWRERIGGGAGDGLGQIEQRGVLALAEVLRAEEFRQTDDLGALAGGLAHPGAGALEVLVRIGRAVHLNQADGEIVAGQGFNLRSSNKNNKNEDCIE